MVMWQYDPAIAGKLLQLGIRDFKRSQKLVEDLRAERHVKNAADYEAPSLSPVLARHRR